MYLANDRSYCINGIPSVDIDAPLNVLSKCIDFGIRHCLFCVFPEQMLLQNICNIASLPCVLLHSCTMFVVQSHLKFCVHPIFKRFAAVDVD